MAKKGFDLAALAKSAMGDAAAASNLDTMTDIPAAQIAANSANFYEMSDLEELAGSIETGGLLHPVLVRPREGGGYTLIDGERRFRAMTDVLGWATVPCIVRQPMNAVVEELMLIEANRTQRKISAADLSKQAERYTELLAQLKDAGVEIPGRLQDRVAEALEVSATKLKRLHAIRANLEPSLLAKFDAGEINESVAYELQKLTPERQIIVYGPEAPSQYTVTDLARTAARFDATECPLLGVGACDHVDARLIYCRGRDSWKRCSSGCCRNCYDRKSCKAACPRLAEEIAAEKAERKAEKKQIRDAEKENERRRITEADADWSRFKALREQCGIPVGTLTRKSVWLAALGEYEDRNVKNLETTVRGFLGEYQAVEHLADLADVLGVTMDEVLGRTPPVSNSDTTPKPGSWCTGTPKASGLYAVRLKASETSSGEIHNFARWTGYSWQAVRSGKAIDLYVAFWSPLPDITKED